MLDSIILGVMFLLLGCLIYLIIWLVKIYEAINSILSLLVDRDIIDTVDKSEIEEVVKDNPYRNPVTGLYDAKYYKQNIRKG